MFVKLFKNEIKQSWLEFLILFSIILVAGVLLGVIFNANDSSRFIAVLIVLLVVSLYTVLAMIIKNVIVSLHSRIFSKEGYLTFTIPATVDQLVWAKLLANLFWIVCSVLVGYCALVITTWISPNLFSGIINEVAEFLGLDVLGKSFWIAFINIIISTLFELILILLTMTILYIGKIKKGKIFVGLLIYGGLTTFVSALTTGLNPIIDFSVVMDQTTKTIEIVKTSQYLLNGPTFLSSASILLNFNSVLWFIVLGVGAYFLLRYLLKNKLEME